MPPVWWTLCFLWWPAICICIFIRPPDIHVGGLIIYHGFFLSSSLFFRRLISKLAERNSTKIGHILGSNFNLKTHVQNLGYTLLYKSGAQNHLFWTTSQLNGNFNGLYLRKETRYRQLVKCVDNDKGSPTSCENDKRLQTGPPFYLPSVNSAFCFASNWGEFSPTLRKICIPLHCQVSQMDISKRNSTKLCQMAKCKIALTICCRTVGVVLSKKLGAKKRLHLCGFSMTSRLNAEYLLNETRYRQSGKVFGEYKGLLHCPKISWTLVHKRLNTGPEFLPTLTILFRHSPSHTLTRY